MTKIFFEIDVPDYVADELPEVAETLTASMIKAIADLKKSDGYILKYKLGYIYEDDNSVEF